MKGFQIDSELLSVYRHGTDGLHGVDNVMPGMHAEYIKEFLLRSTDYAQANGVSFKEATRLVSEQLRSEEKYFRKD